MTPNQIYKDTNIYGGIPVSSNDIMKIFADVERLLKVHRSMIKLQLKNDLHIYTLYTPEMVTKLNGTMVIARAYSLDMSTIYLFDPKTDAFLCHVKEFIPVYGDKKSMEGTDDEKKIMGHSQKIKAIERFIEQQQHDVNEIHEEEQLPNFQLNIVN